MVRPMELDDKKRQLISLGWGFAESTLFFIAPEAWTSYVAVTKGTVAAYIAVGLALIGMVVGATVMFLFGAYAFEAAQTVVGLLPLIDENLMWEANETLRVDAEFGSVFGAFRGIPNKVLSIHASPLDINLFLYLFIFMFASAVRMLAVTSAALVLGKIVGDKLDEARRGKLAIGVWVGIDRKSVV